MIKYRVSELRGNEILARPVCLEDGQILLKMGTKMKTSYKESLTALNIQEVFIQDIFEKYERPSFFLTKNKIHQYCQELQEIFSHHVYKNNEGLKKLTYLAENIVEEIQKIEGNKVFDIKDRTSSIYEHTIFTTLMVLLLAKEYGFSKNKMENMALGSLLHDLGLCYIDVPYINCVQEEMTPLEVYELKQHTIFAYTALEREEWLPEIAKRMILFHHEKIDGSGYPLKQKSQEVECRMIQVCDTLDRMISGIETERTTIEAALEVISNKNKYDADMTKALKSKIALYPVGTRMKLVDGEAIVVIAQTENPLQPQIMSIKGNNLTPKTLKKEIIHIF